MWRVREEAEGEEDEPRRWKEKDKKGEEEEVR